jgi:hypothetical protein
MDLNDLKNNPEQIQTLIALLSSLLPSNQTTEQSSVVEVKEPKSKSKIKTKSKKMANAPVKKTNSKTIDRGDSTNLFEDMPEMGLHKEDVEIDKKLHKLPPTKRTRSVSLINVVCRVCGSKDTISPALLFDSPGRYKCNKCARTSG